MKYWDRAWNPVYGCKKCSIGCDKCYSEVLAYKRGLCEDFSVVEVNHKQLNKSFDIEPELIAVCFQSDLFQEEISDSVIDGIIRKCARCDAKRFLFLTKRAERMKKYFDDDKYVERIRGMRSNLSLDNLIFGVSAETIDYLYRVDLLNACKHIINRFVALEPLLSPITIGNRLDGLKWLVIGAESGDNRRPCQPEWIADIIDECDAKKVPVFVNNPDLLSTINVDLEKKINRQKNPFEYKRNIYNYGN